MATLPRITPKYTPSTSLFPTSSSQRPQSESLGVEFDAGINTSAAWTEHFDASDPSHVQLLKRRYFSESGAAHGSLSDDEADDFDDGFGDGDMVNARPARALYAFSGKLEFQELVDIEAGDELEILKEDVGDGWSLVRAKMDNAEEVKGEVGLLPRSYYTYTTDFIPSPSLQLSALPDVGPPISRREASAESDTTPRGSPRPPAVTLPLFPQNTGEWMRFPSFRQSLLGGKSLNRFSSFVTSGAEAWVLKGSPDPPVVSVPGTSSTEREEERLRMGVHARESTTDSFIEEENRLSRLGMGEADRHYVDAGPAWKEKIPPFKILVHSPAKQMNILTGAYTVYSVTSLFLPDSSSPGPTPTSLTNITVSRRFSHFVLLHTALSRRLPGIALPPLPEKQYAGRFSDEFVEARRGDLERYLLKIVRHPVARYAEILTFFLGCESEAEWTRLLPQHLSLPAAGPAFYARVFHPAFNIDAEDAQDAVEAFENHTKAVGKGVQALRGIFGRVREARVEMSKAERLLSYSLLSLITSKPLASAPSSGVDEVEEDSSSQQDTKTKGLMNSEGAWCWREGCVDCLKLTKAMQKTSETLQSVADLYDDHARRTQLATHESLKNMAHPSSLYEGVVTTHRSTLSRYHEATVIGQTDEDMAARCETVLNTTMAEMETYHTQKVEDFRTLAQEHIDGEIKFYEQVIARLRTAQRSFSSPHYEQLSPSPCQPSIYERELENPRLGALPLPQPCPHVFDSTPMRPVSVAIQEGVGILLGGGTRRGSGSHGTLGRGSVFGNFW